MDKLDKIIAQLDELEISQKHREELLKRNQTTFLLRLPKVLNQIFYSGYFNLESVWIFR